MSLKSFHIVFIVASFALGLGMGFWCVETWRSNGETLWLAAAVGCFVAACALVVYGAWFLRKIRKWERDAALEKTRPIRDLPGGGAGPRAARHPGV